jgi:hypothetical protein
MRDLNHYRFTSVWQVDADPGEVFEVLRDLRDYPAWWPEIKEMRPLEGNRAAARARSVLPYELRFTMERTKEDSVAGVLEARLAGDLDGLSRFTISRDGSGTRLLFEEEVVTHKRLLNRLALVARQAFKVNHTLMMRHGQAGLRTYLAGFRKAKQLG